MSTTAREIAEQIFRWVNDERVDPVTFGLRTAGMDRGLVRQAMDIVRDNPREASGLVRRYFPDMDDAIYNAAFEKYRKGVPTSPMVVNDQLEKLLKFMQISKGTPMNATLADVFHPGIAEEVIKTTGRRS